jgi:hypothetical protein
LVQHRNAGSVCGSGKGTPQVFCVRIALLGHASVISRFLVRSKGIAFVAISIAYPRAKSKGA